MLRRLVVALSIALCLSPVFAQTYASRTLMTNAGTYNSGITYAVSDVVQAGGAFYISITAGNVGNPVTDSTHWQPWTASSDGIGSYTINGKTVSNGGSITLAPADIGAATVGAASSAQQAATAAQTTAQQAQTAAQAAQATASNASSTATAAQTAAQQAQTMAQTVQGAVANGVATTPPTLFPLCGAGTANHTQVCSTVTGTSIVVGTIPSACVGVTSIWCATIGSVRGTPTPGQAFMQPDATAGGYIYSFDGSPWQRLNPLSGLVANCIPLADSSNTLNRSSAWCQAADGSQIGTGANLILGGFTQMYGPLDLKYLLSSVYPTCYLGGQLTNLDCYQPIAGLTQYCIPVASTANTLVGCSPWTQTADGTELDTSANVKFNGTAQFNNPVSLSYLANSADSLCLLNGVETNLGCRKIPQYGSITSALSYNSDATATTSATLAPVTCKSFTCTTRSGTYEIQISTLSAGSNLLYLQWDPTPVPMNCEVHQNGGPNWLGIGNNNPASVNGFIVVMEAGVSNMTVRVSYNCTENPAQ